MGIISHSMQLQTLIQRRNDYEMRIQAVAEELSGLIAEIEDLTTTGSLLDTDSDALRELKAEKERLNLIEKKLEMRQKHLQTKLDATNQEIQSCEQALGKNIQGAFSYTLGGQ